MLKKCLIALALIAIMGGSIAQADVSWGVTTAMAYDWAEKTAKVDVYIKVVRWAQIYTKYAVVLTQQNDGTFCGCTWIQVCCNFQNLRIDAELTLLTTDSTADLAEKWYLALLDSGQVGPLDLDNTPQGIPCTGQQYTQVIGKGAQTNKATMVLVGPHLTGSLAYVQLCVKADGVDPQAMEFLTACPTGMGSKANIQKVARVKLTYYPNDPPSECDWEESFSSAPPFAYDSGLPNVPGDIPNGDGQSHGLAAN